MNKIFYDQFSFFFFFFWDGKKEIWKNLIVLKFFSINTQKQSVESKNLGLYPTYKIQEKELLKSRTKNNYNTFPL